MSGVRQIGNTKYQVYTVFKQNVKRHCEAWKKQYGDLGQTYVQF